MLSDRSLFKKLFSRGVSVLFRLAELMLLAYILGVLSKAELKYYYLYDLLSLVLKDLDYSILSY